MMVVAGDYSLSIYEGTEQEILPQLLVPHPQYNNTTNNNDIMLIKVRLDTSACPWVAPPTHPALSPAEGAGLPEQLRLHSSAAPPGRLHRGGPNVPGVRVGLHQPQHRGDPLHPPHRHAAHRLHTDVQQQRLV